MMVAMTPHTATMMPASSAVERDGVDLLSPEDGVDDDVDGGGLVW